MGTVKEGGAILAGLNTTPYMGIFCKLVRRWWSMVGCGWLMLLAIASTLNRQLCVVSLWRGWEGGR